MIVAGLGYRKGVSASHIESALAAALRSYLRPGHRLDCLAVPAVRADEPGLIAVAAARGLRVVSIAQEALEAASPRAITSSKRSLAALSVPSAAECAALAACGSTAQLMAARLVVGPVTCALCIAGPAL